MKCIRFKRTPAGRRCAKYSGKRKRKRRSHMRGSLGTTKGMHCVRYQQTRAGKRCAKYA